MVNEIQVRHGNQLSNKSQEQLRRVNKALMYVLKELGAASLRLVWSNATGGESEVLD
jgi:hypothetical protein